MQPKFTLLDGFRYYDIEWYLEKGNDRKYKGIIYTPDFKISIKGLDKDIIWETKGRPTEAYNMRKKMWYNLYGKEYYFIQSSTMKHQRKVLDDILERINKS